MDIITQGLLGATTFALVKDKEIGKKSLLIGAVAGIIPDMDMLLTPLFTDVEGLTVHRSVSHSIVLAIVLSISLGYLFHRVYSKKHSLSSWMAAFFLAIFTHSLLDWFTTYGTKLLSPFSSHLFSLNSIFIFEPIYTFILLIGVLVLVVKKLEPRTRLKIASVSLIASTLYLFSTYASKNHAFFHFQSELQRQKIDFKKILVSPTPLNSFLWHGIIKSENGYYFATYSIFDKRENIEFQFVESHNIVIPKIESNRLVKYYLNYTQDFPLIKKDELGNVKIYAVKYGPINYFGEPEFVYPLCFNENNMAESEIKIEYSGKQRGPVKNYNNLFKRVCGI